MKRIAMAAGAMTCLAGGMAFAQPSQGPAVLSVARIVDAIQEGQSWGSVHGGLLCLAQLTPLNWGTGPGKLNVRAFEGPARSELKKEGFTVSGDQTDPFAQDKTADLAIGGTITAVHADFCYAQNILDATAIKGSTSIEVDWQLYSNIERRTLAKIHTTGAAKTDVSTRGGFQTLLIEALNESLNRFMGQDDIKRLVATNPSAVTPPQVADNRSAIVLAGSAAPRTTKVSDAVGSVVLILSGDGHGSGFLVSSDGYLMTAQHVVGSDKYVKIRWSDGLEGVGEVVRTDKRRDVAIIKVDPRGRQPLGLHRTAPEPGDTVFAIGAPLDIKNQGTVTRGVASANRIMDGFSFIQSDVTINGGNSGGPLLNEKGEVLGICDLSFRERGDVPTGINYFVPIDDALRFLSAEPR